MDHPTPIRIVIADDHETVREGLRALLASVTGVAVIADVGDTESAVTTVQGLVPDLLILDLAMPTAGGLETIRRLVSAGSTTAIIVLSRYRDPAFVHEAMTAGARGYVLKQSPFAELERAVSAVARGATYVDVRLSPPSRSTIEQRPPAPLSKREGEVLRRAALGLSNKEIAAALDIAVKTIEVHKTNGMRKLGLRDRRALVRYATLQGWLREP